jgi:hypothetical protein
MNIRPELLLAPPPGLGLGKRKYESPSSTYSNNFSPKKFNNVQKLNTRNTRKKTYQPMIPTSVIKKKLKSNRFSPAPLKPVSRKLAPSPKKLQLTYKQIQPLRESLAVKQLTGRLSDSKNLVKKRKCLQTGQCITFGPANYIQKIFQFTNFNFVIPSDIKFIGEVSANGFVTELHYQRQVETQQLNSYAILKSSQEKFADNLYYEYLIGKNFINYWNERLPCFVETFGLYENNFPPAETDPSNPKKNIRNNLTLDELKACVLLDDASSKANPDNIIGTACEKSEKLSLLIQHIHNAKTIYSFHKENKNESSFAMIFNILLFQVYVSLDYLKNKFTHYDLHSSNVLLYTLGKEECIKINYIYPEQEIYIYTQHICKIIDYGRSYADIPEIHTLYKKLCTEPSCTYLGQRCGFNQGFAYLEKDENLENQYWIYPLVNNISHDLRLFKEFHPNITKYDSDYGTPPMESDPNDEIVRNVSDAKKVLENDIEARQNEIEDYFKNHTEIGTLNVYLDGSDRPMEFVPLVPTKI